MSEFGFKEFRVSILTKAAAAKPAALQAIGQ
jgi:hypothetical protein